MSLASAVYQGWVRHRRFQPVRHEFRYAVFLLYLDLAELDRVFARRWLWSARRPAPFRFRREDHLGDPALALDEAVRRLVAAATGTRPEGPIRLLTNLRAWGYVFNPVSVFYCFDRGGQRVEAVVADVSNTPWNERHAYVLGGNLDLAPGGGTHRYRFAKDFHVSPFLPMAIDYDWRFRDPGDRLAVHMDCLRDGARELAATMLLRRHEISGATLARAALRQPFMTGKVITAIHWQALRLWWKRAPVYTHPERLAGEPR